jgi:hypothetical protein
VAQAQQDGAEASREDGGHQDAGGDAIVLRGARAEGNIAHQEGYGEPDAGEHRHAEDVCPAQTGVQPGSRQASHQVGTGEDTDRLADQPGHDDTDGRLVLRGRLKRVERDRDPDAQQGEDGHRNASRQRLPPVREALHRAGGAVRLLGSSRQQPDGDPRDGGVNP